MLRKMKTGQILDSFKAIAGEENTVTPEATSSW